MINPLPIIFQSLLGSIWPYLVGGAAILAVVGGIYAKGRIDSTHAAEISKLTEQLKVAKENAAAEKAARQLDAAQAKEDADARYELTTKIEKLNQYVSTLEDANRVCLSGADTDRLRDLWNN